jgi:hypothetical protein
MLVAEVFSIAAFVVLFLAHVGASAWINLIRGGSHGKLSVPSWFPGRQLTGLVYFLPVALVAHALPAGGPLAAISGSLAPYPHVAAMVALYVLPAAIMVAAQGPGHGSYMDAGTFGQRDNEWSSKILDLVPMLREQILRDGVTDQPILNHKGQMMVEDNALRDFSGGLLKGVMLMALPPALVWWAWTGDVASLLYVLAGIVYPLAWFLNNRWWRHLGRIGIAKDTPVYWAELIQGASFGGATWAVMMAVS